MKLDQAAFNMAREFIYKNARLLDRRRFEYHFEGGSVENVIGALKAYQNADGGFGNALEPDIRCPQSQPVPTEVALMVMMEVGQFDKEILNGIMRYGEKISLPNGGFPLALMSINDYPHAPWWMRESDDQPSMNPTGRIVGLLHKAKVEKTGWLEKATQFVWNTLEDVSLSGYHDLIQCIAFLENVDDQAKAQDYLARLDERLSVPGVIEMDPNAQGYVHKVLDWAPTPQSYCAKLVDEETKVFHLKALLEQQQEDGGWPISWPAVSPAGEMEWRGWLTVDRLVTLKTYDLID